MANSRFLPDFALIKWAGRDVIELPDHDATVRPDLRPHIYRMGKKLKDAGANVTVIELPDQGDGKSGADDYIKNEGIEAFLELERHSLDDGRYADLTGDALPSTFRLKNLPAEWLDKSPPPLEYVVDPLLPAQTVALLVAEGGAGKTFLSLRMAIDVATGQPFLGNPTTAGRVAYVALEDPPQVLQRRVHGIYKNQLRTLKPKAAERFRKQLRKRPQCPIPRRLPAASRNAGARDRRAVRHAVAVNCTPAGSALPTRHPRPDVATSRRRRERQCHGHGAG